MMIPFDQGAILIFVLEKLNRLAALIIVNVLGLILLAIEIE